MVSDRIENLHLYSQLSEGIAEIERMIPEEAGKCDGYSVDREHTVIFIVDSSKALFSTSWRENPDSREPLSAVTAFSGSFVLFLPGEPYLAKIGDASVRMYRVE